MCMRSPPVPLLLCALITAILLCSAGCVHAPVIPGDIQAGNSGTANVSAITPAPAGTSYVLIETLAPAPAAAPASPAYQPLVVPQAIGDAVQECSFNFQYRNILYSVVIPVNASLYQAARDSPNKQLNLSGTNDTVALYRNMMNDPAMDPFFTGLIGEISKARYKGGDNMTDDEYLEMVTSFVQQIPVENRTAANPRYPVEVIADGKGTSEEKAMLLTGILSRQGYDTAFLYFPGIPRGASGIGIHFVSNHPSFRFFSGGMRDYVYIETTTTRLIGIYDDQIDTAPDPVVIPLGNGTTGYSHINFVMDIFTDLRTMENQLKMFDEKAGSARQLDAYDYEAAVSYANSYNFVMSTNDPDAAYSTIRASELPHHSVCVTCG
jgi:hypothetical protein